MELKLDSDQPIPAHRAKISKATHMRLLEKTRAAAAAADLLAKHGLELEVDADTENKAAQLVNMAAQDPEAAEKALTPARISSAGAATMSIIHHIMDEFGRQVIHDSVKIRNLVTNKLLIETENDDARIRLRALETLGKFADVGLFADRKEVTITHQTTDDLKQSLRAKLEALKDVTPDEDVIEGTID